MEIRGTWHAGHIGAIPIHLHPSLLGVLPLFGLLIASNAGQALELTLPAPVFSALMIGALFLAVVAHELGHAFAARASGARVTRIVLMISGGVTHIERRATRWQDALWVASAGPLVNLTLGTLGLAIGERVGQVDWYAGLVLFGRFNLLMLMINLLPVGPLDGRRMLHALRRARADR